MLSFLKYIPMLPDLISCVRNLLELIHEVESMVTGAGTGAIKKDLVLTMLTQSVTLGQHLNAPGFASMNPDEIAAAASPVIDVLVGALNAAGIFKAKSAPSVH